MKQLDKLIDGGCTLTASWVRYGGGFVAFLTSTPEAAGIIVDMLGGGDTEGVDSTSLSNCWFPMTHRDTVVEAVNALADKVEHWSKEQSTALELYCRAICETSSGQAHYGLRNAGKRFEELLAQDWGLDTEKYLLDLPGGW